MCLASIPGRTSLRERKVHVWQASEGGQYILTLDLRPHSEEGYYRIAGIFQGINFRGWTITKDFADFIFVV